jgi:hypothetical protein
MAFWQKIPENPEEHAKQQIRELGKALVKSTNQVDKSYPNYQASVRIQQEFRGKVGKVLAKQRIYEQKLWEAEDKRLHKRIKKEWKRLGIEPCGTHRSPFT